MFTFFNLNRHWRFLSDYRITHNCPFLLASGDCVIDICAT
jgi:hypothetical protein